MPTSGALVDDIAVAKGQRWRPVLTLRSWLILSLGFLLALALIAGMILDTRTAAVHQRVLVLADVHLPSSFLSEQLATEINASLAALRGWMLTADPKFKVQRASAWVRIGRIQGELGVLRASGFEEAVNQAWGELTQLLTELEFAQQRIEDVASSPKQANRLLMGEGVPRAEELLRLLEVARRSGGSAKDSVGLAQLLRNQVYAEVDEIASGTSRITWWIRTLALIFLGLTLGVALRAESIVVSSVDVVHAAVVKLAQGDTQERPRILSQIREVELLDHTLDQLRQLRLQDLRELMVSERRLKALYANSVDPVITIDMWGRIQSVSDSVVDLFGHQPDDLIGKNVRILMPQPYRDEHDGYLKNYLETRVAKIIGKTRELRAVRANGSVFPFELTVTRVDIPGNPEPMFMGTIRDVSQRKADEAEIERNTQELERLAWLKANVARIAVLAQGEAEPRAMAQRVVSELAELLTAGYGAMYVLEQLGGRELVRLGSFAATRDGPPERCRQGEGLVGQCALERRTLVFSDVPQDYLRVVSGLGESSTLRLVLVPVIFEDVTLAVVELASFQVLTQVQQEFLEQLSPSLGPIINSLLGRRKTEALLADSRRQAEQLEQRRIEIENSRQELESRARDLTAASRYKSEFLANMSHELRTPLNSLLLLASFLTENKAGNLSADDIESTMTIERSGKDLLRLIDDILDLSKVEAGHMEICLETVITQDLLDNVREQFKALAERKGLTFEVSRASTVPRTWVTDGQRLGQILKNLVANAMKFTADGSITLAVYRPGQDGRQRRDGLAFEECIAFSVRDTGVGISEEQRERIFGAFQQADGSTTRTYGGTGLGLTISRQLTELLGGEIQLESEPGKGSTFTLYLPSRPATPASAALVPAALVPAALVPAALVPAALVPAALVPVVATPSEPFPESHGDLQGRHVLLVDDDMRNLFALSQVLHQEGLIVTRAENGEVALEKLRQEPSVELVLMDVMMPVMDGYEAIRRIRGIDDFKALPVIALTAQAMPEDFAKCIEAGASDYVAKPVELSQLISRIRTWLGEDDGESTDD